MSHGPFGLDGGTLGPAPAGCAIVNVTPASASSSANISTGLILVFMRILILLLPCRVYSGIWNSHGSGDVMQINQRGTTRGSTWNLRSEEHTSELQSLRHLVCR